MVRKVFCLIIICFYMLSIGYAIDIDNEIRDIKLSGQYYFGESSGKYTSATRDSIEIRLKLSAQQDLVLNIQSFVCASIEQVETSSATTIDESLNKQMLISGSMIAGNIKYLVQTDNKKLKVLAYLAKVDLTRTEQDYIKRIQDTTTLAESKENSVGLCHALSLYYTAWLQSSFISTAIPYSTLSGERKQDIRAFLSDKLDTCLRSVIFTTHLGIPMEKPTYQIPLHITMSGVGASDHIQLSVPAWSYEQISFKNNELILYSENMPSKSTARLTVKIIISPELVKSDPVLWNIAQNRTYSLETYLDIDYSAIIKTDFGFTNQDFLYAFEPEISNLSIATHHWTFGDGNQSEELNPQHIYSQSGIYEVCLLVNGSIRVTKTIVVTATEAGKKTAKPAENLTIDKQTANNQLCIDESDVIPHVIHELMECPDYSSTIKKLSQYKKAKKLLWGKTQDFLYPDKCWLLVFNPDNHKLEAVLSPGKDQRVEFISKTEILDYGKVYTNKGVICVQLN